MEFHLKEWPKFHEHFKNGGLMLDDYVVELLGDVAGMDLLDVCCACDAKQAFSWANLGAKVTACDLSPEAIRIARENAKKIGLDVEFHVADAQTLVPIGDRSFDVVFATYLCWFEDIPTACRNWLRVLRPGGRLLMHFHHPFSRHLGAEGDALVPSRSYFDVSPSREDFTGTDLAGRHGGWGKSVPCVEFHHTLTIVLNAALAAGFRLLRIDERCHAEEHPLSQLPTHVAALWQRPDRES